MHSRCFQEFAQSDYKCPYCKKAVGDMTQVWKRLDEKIQNGELDLCENKEKPVAVLCNECGNKEGQHFFTPFGLYKCKECESYNTNLI